MSREKQYASYKSLAPTKKNKDEYTCIEIQNLEHRKNILNENLITCVYIYSNWCEPCKIFGPKFSKLSKDYNNPGRCLLVKENFDLKITHDFQITGIPVIIFYLRGKLLKNSDGTPVSVIGGDIQQVREILNKLL